MLRAQLKERSTCIYRIVSIDNGAAPKAAAMRIRRVTDIPINKAVPRIHHVGIRPGKKKRPDIMQAACDNLHISGQARRLLAFYADQADGFTPALELIHKKTGLDRKDFSKIRKLLVDNGFIRYEPNKVIDLDWDRIRLYSTFDKDKVHPKRGGAKIAPSGSVPCGARKKPSKKIKYLLAQYKYTEAASVREINEFESRLYKILEDMTEDEVRMLFGGAEPICVNDRLIYYRAEDMDYKCLKLPAMTLPHSRDPLPF